MFARSAGVNVWRRKNYLTIFQIEIEKSSYIISVDQNPSEGVEYIIWVISHVEWIEVLVTFDPCILSVENNLTSCIRQKECERVQSSSKVLLVATVWIVSSSSDTFQINFPLISFFINKEFTFKTKIKFLLSIPIRWVENFINFLVILRDQESALSETDSSSVGCSISSQYHWDLWIILLLKPFVHKLFGCGLWRDCSW